MEKKAIIILDKGKELFGPEVFCCAVMFMPYRG